MKQAIVLVASVFCTSVAFSNPVINPAYGPNGVSQGVATVSQQANTVTIQQSSNKAIINWNSFNIANGEKTQFIQPNSSSIALNRISGSASEIYGSLSANGHIILVNPAGIYFGPSAMVNVGGLIASTSDISNANFMAGNYVFDKPGSGSITNAGKIIAAENGLVALVGSNVTNTGLIQAQMGSIVLASGNKFTFDFYGDQLINFVVGENSSEGGKITNSGTVIADGGKVLINANAAQHVLDDVVDMTGVAQANSVKKVGGQIVLGQVDIQSNGDIQISGKVSASGKSANATGGNVKVLTPKNITLTSSANIDVSGDIGGGTILIGGNLQGKGLEVNAKNTYVAQGARLNADALTQGDGGRIIVWSNDKTSFAGSLSARGGMLNGNGGFAEVSGHQLLNYSGSVNLSAPKGITGTLLLDPENLTIQSVGPTTADATGSPTDTFTGNIDSSILTVADLENALQNSSVLVLTGTGGSEAGDINVLNSITWSNSNTLTLSAYHDITINPGVTISNNNDGSLILRANNEGAFSTAAAGGIVTINGDININGTGLVSVYYNPTDYATPTTYTNSGTAAVTAYMYINSLGTESDGTNVLSLGALSNPGNHTALWNDPGKNFALSTDIDAAATSGWNSGAGFSPIGDYTVYQGLSGSFDGLNHTISNYYSTQGGIFKLVNLSGVIKNLNMIDGTLNLTDADNVYGFVANEFVGTMNNVSVTGMITSLMSSGLPEGLYPAVGGLVGNNIGDILNSNTAVPITINYQSTQGGDYGGLAGLNQGLIDNSYATGDINSTSTGAEISYVDLGGLAGYNGWTIQNSYATGNITISDTATTFSDTAYVGGLVGYNDGGQIFYSHANGSITSDLRNGYYGGLMGWSVWAINNDNLDPNYGNPYITNSYATGQVKHTTNQIGEAFLGGFVGWMRGTGIANSYSTGDVIHESATGSSDRIGGFVGSIQAAGLIGEGIFDSYSTGNVTNTVTNQNDSNDSLYMGGFIGWNTFDYYIGPNRFTTIQNSYASGNVTNQGSQGTYSIIGGFVGLNDVSGNNKPRIISSYATGNIYSYASNDVSDIGGFAGDNYASITSSYSTGSIFIDPAANTPGINYNYAWVGGFAAYNEGTIIGSHSDSNITSTAVDSGMYIGGFAAYHADGTINHSYATGNITINPADPASYNDAEYIGGFVGENDWNIGFSYATGNIISNQSGGVNYIGGFAGYDTWRIEDSYATGSVTNNLGSNYVGGFEGYHEYGRNLTRVYATGDVINNADVDGIYLGGLVGYSTYTIAGSYATGNVINNGHNTGSDIYVGGLVGLSDAVISSSYSTGNVINNFAPNSISIGGLVGVNNSGIYYSYSNGLVANYANNSNNAIGGLVGNNYSNINNSYSSATVIVSPTSSLSVNTDLVGGLIGKNNGNLDTTYSDGYIVSTASNSNLSLGGLVGRNSSNADIYHSHSNATISIEPYDLSSTNTNNIGGLVGTNNDGWVEYSYANATIRNYANGTSNIGGAIGLNNATTTDRIYQTYSLSDVTNFANNSSSNIGGFIGQNIGDLHEAYAIGKVTLNLVFGATSNTDNVGGFVGLNSGVISNTYSTGEVSKFDFNQIFAGNMGGFAGSDSGAINASFWDTVTSKQATGAGVGGASLLGKTTQEMLSLSTFQNEGWSISNTVNYCASAFSCGNWFIFEGATRPILYGEFSTDITNPHQLQFAGSYSYISYNLNANIDMGSVSNPSDIWAGNGFRPIGTDSPYASYFYGNNFTISNLTVSNNSSSGLFGFLQDATISDLRLVNLTVLTPGNFISIPLDPPVTYMVGGIAGRASGNTSLYNVYVSGKILDLASGYNQDHAGGLIGLADQITITNSYADVFVHGIENVGGLVGTLSSGSIVNSASFGTVIATGNINTLTSAAGGLVGNNAGSIVGSYSTAATSLLDLGYVGGLVGNNTGTIDQSYSSGFVTGTDVVGGLVGTNSGLVSNSFWDVVASGQANSVEGIAGSFDGSVGVNLSQLATYTNAGWSITSDPLSSSSNPWFIFEGGTRPMLMGEAAAENYFAPDQVYTVTNAHQLQLMGARLDLNYELGSNISLSAAMNNLSDVWGTKSTENIGSGFIAVGQGSEFIGYFNGHNYSIDKLYINAPFTDQVGLFANTTGTISNVALTNVKITGNNETGGLIAHNNGNVANVYVTGFVKGNGSSVGGLVGMNDTAGVISNSYNAAVVTALSGSSQNIGGLVGENSGSISNAYAYGNVNLNVASNTNTNVGGIAGLNNGTIEKTYYSGVLSLNGSSGANLGGVAGNNTNALTDSFYDATLSASCVNCAGTGLQTTDMTNQSNYTNWNFSNDWTTLDGYIRPILRSEYSRTITNAHQLQLMQLAKSDKYILANDINASGTSNVSDVWLGRGLISIGLDSFSFQGPFTGDFDGKNYVISNLTTVTGSGQSGIGLFGIVDSAYIANVGVINSTFNAYNASGAIAGSVYYSYIDHVWGSNNSITSQIRDVGGLVGYLENSILTNSYNQSNIVYNSYFATGVGGLVGEMVLSSLISNSYNAGSVTTNATDVGGIVGTSYASHLLNVYNIGTVNGISGANNLGGLIGGAYGNLTFGNSTISNSYNSGAVSGSTSGGIVGNASSLNISNTFWDTDTSNQSAAYGSTNSVTETNVVGGCFLGSCTNGGTAILSDQALYTGAGWDFANTWTSIDGRSRPLLQMEHTQTIRNAHQLQLMGNTDLPSLDIVLANNINASGTSSAADIWGNVGFTPVDLLFSSFNGQNHTISNLYISNENVALPSQGGFGAAVGLFGSVGNTLIRNVALQDLNYQIGDGSVFVMGGLVGMLSTGTILNSYTTGNISVNNSSDTAPLTGGMIGYSVVGNIYNNYSSTNINVTAPDDNGVAGFIGGAGSLFTSGHSNIINNYSTGAVQLVSGGTNNAAGFVAFVEPSTTRFVGNYWDIDASGQTATSAYATGKTTVEMQQQATFVGYDFLNTWKIFPGFSYPLLSSFMGDGARIIQGTAPVGSGGNTINLAVAGSVIGSATINAANQFFLISDYADNSLLFLYLTGGSFGSNYILRAPDGGDSIANLVMQANTVDVGNATGNTYSNTILGSAINGLSAGDNILYALNGNDLEFGNSTYLNVNLNIHDNYNLDGDFNNYVGASTYVLGDDNTQSMTLMTSINIAGGAGSTAIVNAKIDDSLAGTNNLSFGVENGVTINGDIGSSQAISYFEIGQFATAVDYLNANITSSSSLIFSNHLTIADNGSIHLTANNMQFLTIDGHGDLRLTADDVVFNASIGATDPLKSLALDFSSNASFGAVIFLSDANTVIHTTGAQTYNNGLYAFSDTNPTLSFTASDVIIPTHLANFLYSSSIPDITLNVSGTNSLINTYYSLNSVTKEGTGTLTLGSNTTSAFGDPIGSQVIVNGGTLILSSADSLGVQTNAGSGTFAFPLLTINSGGTAVIDNVMLNANSFNPADDITTILLNGGTLSGNGAASVSLDAIIRANGNSSLVAQDGSDSLEFNSSINKDSLSSAASLFLQGNGNIILKRVGDINPIDSITSSAITTLSGITTTGNQVYNGLVNSANGTASVFESLGGNISFLGDIATPYDENFIIQEANTLSLNSTNNLVWDISGSYQGSLQNAALTNGATFLFTNTSNLTGSTLSRNTFNFYPGTTMQTINGGNTAADANTIDYSNYGSAVTIQMIADHVGTTYDSANIFINDFSNIQNLLGSNSEIQTAVGKQNTIVITGAGQGYINDPTNFSGFNNFVSKGVNDIVVFNVPGNSPTYSRNTGQANVSGSSMSFSNSFSPQGSYTSSDPTPAPEPQPEPSPPPSESIPNIYLQILESASNATVGAYILSVQNTSAPSSSSSSSDGETYAPGYITASPIVIRVNSNMQEVIFKQQKLDVQQLLAQPISPNC